MSTVNCTRQEAHNRKHWAGKELDRLPVKKKERGTRVFFPS
jgi:hypothetical protein